MQEVVTQDTKIEENAPKSSYSKKTLELCNIIKTADRTKITEILHTLNVPILKQHGFTLSPDDSDDVLCEKLNHFQDVNVFTKAINNMLS